MKDLFHKDGATSKAAKVNIAWQSKDVTSGPFSKEETLVSNCATKKMIQCSNAPNVWNIYLHLGQVYGKMSIGKNSSPMEHMGCYVYKD